MKVVLYKCKEEGNLNKPERVINMKTAKISADAYTRLKLERIYDTRSYRYMVDEDKVYRIAIDALDTSAVLADASEINPYGWERVALRLPNGEVKEYV